MSSSSSNLVLEIQQDLYAVAQLQSSHAIPEWALRSPFFSVSKTSTELSIVCMQAAIPDGVKCEPNWRAVKVKRPLDFGLTGILASIAKPLSDAKISIFAISTFETDYVLVKQENLERATQALKNNGHTVEEPSTEMEFVQPDLQTERLTLEPITEGHAAELCDFFADNELHTYVPYEPLTLEKQRERCARWARRKSPDGKELWLNWFARDVSTRLPVGHFQSGLKEDGVASIGYVVARKFQGKGYATEALQTIFEYLQNNLKAVEVKAWSDTRNLASHRVAAKMGMTQVELIKDADFFRGATSDEFVFSKMLRNQP